MPDILPPQVLSAAMFTGAGLHGAEREDALARYTDRREIARAVDAAAEAGCGGILTLGDEAVVAALKTVRARRPGFQVLPVIPNVLGYVREATEHGLAGAGLRRLARVGPLGFARAGLAGALHTPQVLRKDFPTLLSILYELEMGEMRRFRPPAVFLHHQMTDLALAFANPKVFRMFARIMRRRYGTEPALATSNFPALARFLRRWRVPIDMVAAPVNPEARLMPGGVEETLRAAREGCFYLVADKVAPDSPTPAEALEWAAAQPGVVSVARLGAGATRSAAAAL